MQLLPALRRKWDSLFWTQYRFRIPRRTLPPVLVRPLQDEDITVCHEIYKLNEPLHFPPGYFEHFCHTLTNGKTLFMVVEEKGKVLGFAGICMHTPPAQNSVGLTFGMVYPEAQRRGIGTVLLLARLAILPMPKSGYILYMSPIANSQPFFRQFGFGFVRHFRDHKSDLVMDSFSLIVRRPGLRQCREKLKNSNVTVESDVKIPVVGLVKGEDRLFRPAQ